MLNIHQTMAECDCPRPDKCTLAGRCLASGSACPQCAQWTAASEEQLDVRLKNMALHPEVRPYPCTQCGSTDWAYLVLPRPSVRQSDPAMVPVFVAVALIVAGAAVVGWFFGAWLSARPVWSVVLLMMTVSAVTAIWAMNRGRR